MKVQVFVRLKSGVLDVQGKAVERGLHEIGHPGVSELRIGKCIEFAMPDMPEAEARRSVEQMCAQLLANPVMESFEIVFPKGR